MMSPVETEKYYTAPEVAALLNVTPSAIRSAIKDGRLPAEFKYGRQWVLKTDAHAYIDRVRPNGIRPPGRRVGAKDINPRKRRKESTE